MKILIVASFNKGYFAPFIVEQAEALHRIGCEIDFFGITRKGICGYVNGLPALKRKIREYQPDIIHAHYGLSGLFANMQRRVPVVTTYHGSDINEKSVLPFSKISMLLSRFNIFVSQRTIDIAKPKNHYALIPCGVELNELQLTGKFVAKERMGLDADKKYVLFSGAFDNPVKNYPLAKATMDLIPEAGLLELKGFTREQVTFLMCAADAILMTSFTEGSPQVIKEAMACGLPVVSVGVGDVSDVCLGVDGCYICQRDRFELQQCINDAFTYERTTGRYRIEELGYDNASVVDKILDVYELVVKN